MADRQENNDKQGASEWLREIWKRVKEVGYRIVTFCTSPMIEAAMPIVEDVARQVLAVARPSMAGIGFAISIAGIPTFVGLNSLLTTSLQAILLGIRLIRHFCGQYESSQMYGETRYLN